MAEKTTKKAFTMPNIITAVYFRDNLRADYLLSIQNRVAELYPNVQTLKYPITGAEWLSVRTRFPLSFIKYKLQKMNESVVNGKIYRHDHAALILLDWLRTEYKERLSPQQQLQLDDQTISEFPEILRIIRDYNVITNENQNNNNDNTTTGSADAS